MMRLLLVGICLSIGPGAFAQDRAELWLSAGIKRDISKNLVASIGSNARIRYDGNLQTLFQDVSLKSEHLSWFRPSFEYRFITSYDKYGNYSYSNRMNFNVDFRHKIEDIKFGTRLRYQTFIGRGTASGGDLDPSFRIKPYFSYEPKKSKVSPEISVEFFYNPVNELLGKRFNRTRFGLTANIDLPKSNSVSITYYYGRRFNNANPYQEHLLSLEYGFEWKKKK